MSESPITKWTHGEIDGVEILPLAKHEDARGWLCEVFRSDQLAEDLTPAMGYISVTHAGAVRGPHAHTQQTDCFAFIATGLFELRLWDNREASPTRGHRVTSTVGEANPTLVVIPPGVIHGYRNISDTDGIVLNFPNRLYAGIGRKQPVDEIRYEDADSLVFAMED